MVRKGFRVTSDIGCIAPADRFTKEDNFKGYQKTFYEAFGFLPVTPDEVPRDEFGRDITAQLSHLCHRHWCCRPDHLSFETKWRNFSRNACLGLVPGRVDGACGCILQYEAFGQAHLHGPYCLRQYSVSQKTGIPEDIPLCKSNAEGQRVLEATNFPWSISFAKEHEYHERDQKALKRKASRQSRNSGKLDSIPEHAPAAKKSCGNSESAFDYSDLDLFGDVFDDAHAD